MKIKPFDLERWLLRQCEIDLAGGGVVKLKLKDITSDMDYNQLLKYGPTNGGELLREEVADWYDVEKDNVLITSGTSEANLLSHYSLLEPGDEYITECPIYQQQVGFAESIGCKIKKFNLNENEEWKPDLEQLKNIVTKRTRIILLDNPNNPTGAVLTEQEMRAICDVAQDVGAYVICDNALRGSELDGKLAATPFPYYEKGVITGSLSKLGMTGLRIGWLIGCKDLVKSCWELKDYTTLSHSGIGEYLAIIALQRENRERYINRNIRISKSNLEILSRWIDKKSDIVSWSSPKGGFTAFLRYKLSLTSVELCESFLKEEKVLISPGAYFGVEKHFRINIGCEQKMLTEGLTRLEAFIKRLAP